MGTMDGIRVVEVASWTYVPIAGAVLAEWGADVIKIEHPESGDPQRGLAAMGLVPTGPGGVAHMMELPNRGKRSVGLDLRTDKGRELLLELCATADVFVTNWRPQAAPQARGSTWRTSVPSTPTSSTCGDRVRVNGDPRRSGAATTAARSGAVAGRPTSSRRPATTRSTSPVRPSAT